MFYKVTRAKRGSGRAFAYGITLAKEGDSVYVNNKIAAMGLAGVGWEVTEVNRVPKGEALIEAEKHKYLKRLLSSQEVHEAMKPKGKWLITAPKENNRFFVFGYDVRKPFTITDFDIAMKFQEQGFKVTQIASEPAPAPEPEPEPQSEAKVEGADEPKPKDSRKFPI